MDEQEAVERLRADVRAHQREQRERDCRRCLCWAVAGLIVLTMLVVWSLTTRV